MTNQKSLLLVIAEWWEERQAANPPEAAASPTPRVRRWLPTPGSVLFTLLAIGGLVWAQSVGAVPGAAPASPDVASTGTVAYQGRLANPAGAPLTGTYGMIFRLYSGAAGGTPLWEEQWTGPNSVQVSDGLFNVMLGSLAAIPQSVMTGNSSLWLGITVGSDDEMTPRVQLGSVPFAVQAITVPDASVTTAKIADGAITQPKAPFALQGPSNNFRIESGSKDTQGAGVINVVFGQTFAVAPKVLLTGLTAPNVFFSCDLDNISVAGFTGRCFYWNGSTIGPAEGTVNWVAIGQ